MQTAIGYIPQGITLFADDPLGRVIVLRPDVVRKFVNHNIGNRLIIQLQQTRAKNVRSLNPGPIPQLLGVIRIPDANVWLRFETWNTLMLGVNNFFCARGERKRA
jgi:hypothetical protein